MPKIPPAHLVKALSDPRIREARMLADGLLSFLDGGPLGVEVAGFLDPKRRANFLPKPQARWEDVLKVLRSKGKDPEATLSRATRLLKVGPMGTDLRKTVLGRQIPKLYHGTSSAVVDKILAEGALLPKDPHPGPGGDPNDEGVYMTPRKWQARRYAASAALQDQPGTVEKDRLLKKHEAQTAGKFQGRKSTPAVLRISPKDVHPYSLEQLMEALESPDATGSVPGKDATRRLNAHSDAYEMPSDQAKEKIASINKILKKAPKTGSPGETRLPYEIVEEKPIPKERLSVSAKKPSGKKAWWPLKRGPLPKGWKYALPALLAMLMALKQNPEPGDTE